MLLKWLFYLLAILWLIQALKPIFRVQPPPPKPDVQKKPSNEEDEYVDYEEVE
jgi:hypothetical protein